jgi:hypothetical protein
VNCALQVSNFHRFLRQNQFLLQESELCTHALNSQDELSNLLANFQNILLLSESHLDFSISPQHCYCATVTISQRDHYNALIMFKIFNCLLREERPVNRFIKISSGK